MDYNVKFDLDWPISAGKWLISPMFLNTVFIIMLLETFSVSLPLVSFKNKTSKSFLLFSFLFFSQNPLFVLQNLYLHSLGIFYYDYNTIIQGNAYFNGVLYATCCVMNPRISAVSLCKQSESWNHLSVTKPRLAP